LKNIASLQHLLHVPVDVVVQLLQKYLPDAHLDLAQLFQTLLLVGLKLACPLEQPDLVVLAIVEVVEVVVLLLEGRQRLVSRGLALLEVVGVKLGVRQEGQYLFHLENTLHHCLLAVEYPLLVAVYVYYLVLQLVLLYATCDDLLPINLVQRYLLVQGRSRRSLHLWPVTVLILSILPLARKHLVYYTLCLVGPFAVRNCCDPVLHLRLRLVLRKILELVPYHIRLMTALRSQLLSHVGPPSFLKLLLLGLNCSTFVDFPAVYCRSVFIGRVY
jgi:hypothetical protein